MSPVVLKICKSPDLSVVSCTCCTKCIIIDSVTHSRYQAYPGILWWAILVSNGSFGHSHTPGPVEGAEGITELESG